MENEYIKIANLTKVIKGITVLSSINLSFNKGKIYGFCGKNGSGKTMLFRSICGLIKPSEGNIIIEGEEMGKELSFPKSVGVLIEYPGFLPNLTGYKNLKYLADINKILKKEDIEAVLERVGLNSNDKRTFKKYSLGMKQRLGIAQAIMEDPEIIILDEPTNALDIDGVKMVNELLLELKKRDKLILIASHDKEVLENISDEIFTIDGGKVISHMVLKEKILNEN